MGYKSTRGLRDLLNFQPGQDNKGLVGAIFTVSPALRNSRIEELGQQPIWIGGGSAHFEETSPLKLGETLQFAARQAR